VYLGFGKWRPWRARRARAYNVGLGADPPAGSRGRAPGRGSGWRSPPEAETLFAFERSMEAANSLIFFLKFGNAENYSVISDAISHGDFNRIFYRYEKNHQTLLNFAILAGKRQKAHLFI